MKNNKFVSLILIPSIIILMIFSFVPLIYGLGISFFEYNPANISNNFIGIENYIRLANDPRFWKALKNTFIFSITACSINIVISLFLSTIISSLKSDRIKAFFRTLIFIPCIAPMVGTAMVWKHGILGSNGGLLNEFLSYFGYPATNWFLTESTLMLIIIIFTLWADIGYNTVLFTTAIESIPKDFEEAASLDGANGMQRFFQIKFPLMSKMFAFISTMTMIDYLQMFTQFSIFATNGGMNDSSLVLTNYVYISSFKMFDMGYASAIATILFIIIMLVTIFQKKITKKDWSYD